MRSDHPLGRIDETLDLDFRVPNEELAKRILDGLSDMGALEWCLATGRKPAEEETLIGKELMRRRGWNDEATETFNRRRGKAASRIAMISARCLTILTRTREGLCQKRDAAGVRTVPLSKIPG